MKTRVTVHLPKDLLGRARRRAAAQGRTLTALIEDGLQLVVAGSREPAIGKRIPPPVSRATAGPMPGTELAKLSLLQELDDADYVERMTRLK